MLIVGLGNPGRKYERTRHNVGFAVLDAIAQEQGLVDFKEKFSGLFCKGRVHGKDAVLLKPMTFMNLSGDCVQPAQVFHKVAIGDIVVIHDELDLPFGELRLKVGGGHAGHNGLRSLIARLGSPDFVRLRVGIGRPPPDFKGDVADYVLHDFDPTERANLPRIVDGARRAVELVLTEGLTCAMNAVNPRGPVRPKSQDLPKKDP